MRSLRWPAHLSSLIHARVDQSVHDGLCSRCGNPQPGPMPSTVVHQCRGIQGQIGRQLIGELDEPLDTRLLDMTVQPDRLAGHMPDVTQRAARLIALAVPDQMAQSRDVELNI